MEKKFGFEKDKNSGPYSELVGEYVKIYTHTSFVVGYLERSTITELFLRPSIVDEGLPYLIRRRLEKKKPTIVQVQNIELTHSVNKSYLDNILDMNIDLNKIEPVKKKNKVLKK